MGTGVVAAVLAFGLIAGGLVTAHYASQDSGTRRGLAIDTSTFLTVTTVYDPNTQVLGPCALTTPPTADPCLAAQGFLRYVFWGALVNATVFANWQKANPGEWARLQSHLATPICSNGSNGQPQDMITEFGAALYAEIQAYACALGTESIMLPPPNPPPAAGAKDKKAPTPPGALTVTIQ